MKKKKKKIETVRLITFDQVVIDVVGGTVSTRREILENFIVANNEMMTVVGGNSLSRLGKNLAAESYVLRINRGKSHCKNDTGKSHKRHKNYFFWNGLCV